MKPTHLASSIEQDFLQRVQRDSHIHHAFLRVYQEDSHLDVNLCYGEHCHVDQPYYIASIGKVFTSALILRLCETQRLNLTDRVMDHLGHDLIDGLHHYKGVNYAPMITIEHLLNHSSGLADYFEDRPIQGPSMLELIQQDPYRHRSPLEIIQWSKDNLRPRFRPGEGFHYSDTGYHLLGLVIEHVVKKPLDEAMKTFIFDPLGLNHTWMMTHRQSDDRQNTVCDVYWGDHNVKDYQIFRDDFAGGGIVSTSTDLLLMMKALINHQLISQASFEKMTTWSPYSSLKLFGISYGLGLMHLNAFPLLFPKKYESFGHIGSIGSFMFYNPHSKTYLIGTVNRFRYHRMSMQLMFQALKKVINTI